MVRYRHIIILLLIFITFFLALAIKLWNEKREAQETVSSIIVIKSENPLNINGFPSPLPTATTGRKNSSLTSKSISLDEIDNKSSEEKNIIRSLPMNYILDYNNNSKISCAYNTCNAKIYIRRDATREELKLFMDAVQRQISTKEKHVNSFIIDTVDFGVDIFNKSNYIEFGYRKSQ